MNVQGDGRAREAWMKASVRTETAKRRRTCRICGKPIRKGEECVVSEDWSLVSLYEAFWSMKVSAHKSCYRSLVGETLNMYQPDTLKIFPSEVRG